MLKSLAGLNQNKTKKQIVVNLRMRRKGWTNEEELDLQSLNSLERVLELLTLLQDKLKKTSTICSQFNEHVEIDSNLSASCRSRGKTSTAFFRDCHYLDESSKDQWAKHSSLWYQQSAYSDASLLLCLRPFPQTKSPTTYPISFFFQECLQVFQIARVAFRNLFYRDKD